MQPGHTSGRKSRQSYDTDTVEPGATVTVLPPPLRETFDKPPG